MNDQTRPPTAEESVAEVLRAWYNKGGRSIYVPINPFDAAKVWISLQEPADEVQDKPEPQTNAKGEVAGWKTPYHDRIIHNLKKFLGMNETHKAWIINRVKAGIPYRGDSIDFYKGVCKQTEIMAQDIEGYIETAGKVVESFSIPDIPTERSSIDSKDEESRIIL